MIPTRTFWLVIWLAVLLSDRPCMGQELEPPFVAGYERRARHGDISQRLAGRLLVSELSCSGCHATEMVDLQAKRGPELDNAGNRLQPDWLRQFLASPAATKPGTTMPDVLNGLGTAEKADAIESIVAFLSAQRVPFTEPKASGLIPVPFEFWNKGTVVTGRQLYHQVGCVACHEPDRAYEGGTRETSARDRLLEQLDPDELAELGLAAAVRPVRSVPHGDLAAKYTRQSLTFLLLDPAAVRSAGRMPSLKLSPMEAADIAAYLLRDQRRIGELLPAASEGVLVEPRTTAVCYPALRELPSPAGRERITPARPMAELSLAAEHGCLGGSPAKGPCYSLDNAQKEAIRLALAERSSSQSSSQRPAKLQAADQVESVMLQLNCYACHERDQRGGVGSNRQRYFEVAGHADLGDEGRLPPPLTGVGRKLQPAWIRKVLEGTGDLRTYLRARMPIYPGNSVATLPQLFPPADASRKMSDEQVFGDGRGLAEAGRRLLDNGCVQCHPVRSESLPSVLGVDLAGVPGRIQPDWFREFLLDPAQLKPRTRMPTFFAQGKSSSPDLLEGQIDRQIAAVWTYLKETGKQPLPDKILQARSQDFELKPAERPILLRTFMQAAGNHAIAVGFPERVHFAFDAEGVRPAQAWRGRFLDAHGTWFDRFAPPAVPLGDAAIALPAGLSFAWLKDPQQPWPTATGEDAGYQFLGYRLDRAGIPSFLYRVATIEVTDRIEPSASRGLKRMLRVRGVEADGVEAGGVVAGQQRSESLWFRALAGRSLQQRLPRSYTNDQGLTVLLSDELDRRGVLRRGANLEDWLVPVSPEKSLEFVVEYQW